VSTRSRDARRTPVSECADLLPIEPVLVSIDADPLEVVRMAAGHPATRMIGVIDPDGRLIGVVPLLRLVETVVARVSPETLLAGDADLAEAARFGTEVGARRIADIMLAPVSIVGTRTVDEAFRLMHARHQSGLIVVDDEGKPTGYLDLLEVALRYLDALEPPASSASAE
jgi:CBS domain-containing protein